MSRPDTLRGQLIEIEGENGGVYLLDKHFRTESTAIAEHFPWGGTITLRWALNDKDEWPDTLDEVAADFLSVLEGESDSKYGARYSELTGYLWTDEQIRVGGHDVLSILKSNLGKYLWMEINLP